MDTLTRAKAISTDGTTGIFCTWNNPDNFINSMVELTHADENGNTVFGEYKIDEILSTEILL